MLPSANSSVPLRAQLLRKRLEESRNSCYEATVTSLSSPQLSEKSLKGHLKAHTIKTGLEIHLAKMPESCLANSDYHHTSSISKNGEGRVNWSLVSKSNANGQTFETSIPLERLEDDRLPKNWPSHTESIESRLTFLGSTEDYKAEHRMAWAGITSDVYQALSEENLIDEKTGYPKLDGTVTSVKELGPDSLKIHFPRAFDYTPPSTHSQEQVRPLCWYSVGGAQLQRVEAPESPETEEGSECDKKDDMFVGVLELPED